jgi:DNA-binding NtrC family response regulator
MSPPDQAPLVEDGFMRVLFVDDEPFILQALFRGVKRHRHAWDLFFATSGQQALRYLGTMPFDAVVTDLMMGGMDGIELLQAIQGKHPDLVRIVLSGAIDGRSVVRAVRWSHRQVCKPITPLKVIEAIEEVRQGQRRREGEKEQ